ncbi:MAG: enoyl-CoA hydratase/isomerase family protein [Ignavibacteria bacterium]|nr:enoyl-CoA hydratase/isomerase family protein [Ignavibacteria bacterium]MBL7991058.1 enoyl-CoA hydratase/isomerase family protein [Candidatus Kapabacteria bacterium]
MQYDNIILSSPADGVGAVQLNRPKVLNALNTKTMSEILHAMQAYDADPNIRCMILHGDERAFAAGADIREMSDATAVQMMVRNPFSAWEDMRGIKKPIIAAVSGFALGGGCELAMLCDMIVASETAQFGQPEIKLGLIPGAGGTQRMTKAIGKARTMDLVLTGRNFTAQEAFDMGLVSRIVPAAEWLDGAIAMAKEIASMPAIAVREGKEAVLKSFDLSIEMGLEFERKNFYLLLTTDDAREGMKAFMEKRIPVWKGQ